MKLEDFKPVSEAIVHQSKIDHPKYPVIDFHTHMGKLLLGDNYQELFDTDEYVNQLKKWGVMKAVNLDGFYGKDLDDMKDKIGSYQDYFINFMWIDFSYYDEVDFESKTKQLILENYEKGARGIKLWKNISLYLKDINGKAIRCDDKRFDMIYDMAAELDIPVLMHIADPVAFFKKVDEYNERIEELSECPDWNFSDSSKYMTFEELMEMQENVIKNHPKTKFVIAHVGSYAENLGWVSQQLHQYPNMVVDIAARIAELGRVPYTARKFFIENQNQIVLGTDSHPLSLGFHTITYRMMETDDEYFAYQPLEKPGQGRWAIYGLHLPDEVLQKVYYKNACRVLKIDEKVVEKEYEKLFKY